MSVIAVLILGGFSGLLFAEQTAYVTDSLRLRVYSEASDTSNLVETIESGDAIEVLETRDAFTRIRTLTGSIGWVKSAFLVEDPPAKLLFYTVSEQNTQLEQQLEVLKDNITTKNAAETMQITELEQALEEQQQANQQLREQLSSLTQNEQEQASHEAQIKLGSYTLPASITELVMYEALLILGIIVIVLMLGMFFGIKFSAMRMQKRLHGYRLE